MLTYDLLNNSPQEVAIDKLNDHLAPAFERLSAYNNAKAEQLALNASSTTSAFTAEVDPLLDAYSPRAHAHKELQTRLAALARSIAALKRTTEGEDFVAPSEESLAAVAAAVEMQEQNEKEEEERQQNAKIEVVDEEVS